jgi:hypothetical protein
MVMQPLSYELLQLCHHSLVSYTAIYALTAALLTACYIHLTPMRLINHLHEWSEAGLRNDCQQTVALTHGAGPIVGICCATGCV